MYGDKGPPKGYSVPRYDTNAKKHCQLCSSAEHWTFECPKKATSSSSTIADTVAKKSSAKTVKLSRSQMLKYGVKPKLAHFVPEPTEREVFDAEMRELRSVLTAEVRSELKAAKATEQKGDSVKLERAMPTSSTASKAESPSDGAVYVKKERSEEGD
ncbi:Zinc knuckle [Lotmaria passim]